MVVKFFTDDSGNAVSKKPRTHRVSTTAVVREHISIAYATDTELATWGGLGYSMIFDIESYTNYFLIGFKCIETGKYVIFEDSPDAQICLEKLNWLVWNFRLIGFNSRNYDIPMLFLALRGYRCDMLKYYTNRIIGEEINAFDVQEKLGLHIPDQIDHIDIMSVCPLKGSLKKYGARIHSKRIQDLPYEPERILTQEEAEHTKNYCLGSDIVTTEAIFNELSEQFKLRYDLTEKYGIDLRSKSDAQIAEAVIRSEVKRKTGKNVKREKIGAGTQFRYEAPAFLTYASVGMQKTLQTIKDMVFEITEEGKLSMPESLSELEMRIGSTVYKLGKGGLHSKEKCASYKAIDGMLLVDSDVESYYPKLILNSGFFPEAIGNVFGEVFEELVNRRITAKRNKNKIDADSLKVTINGSFGKLGSRYSIMYAPNLLIQVTLTGQLALLMLIERMEAAGLQVVSANTDGIVMHVHERQYQALVGIRDQWCRDTALKMEETRYKALYSKDVNNYIAIKEDDKVKLKGAYSNPWDDADMKIFRFHKNPMSTVCIEAVSKMLTDSVPTEKTIRECTDLTKFVCVRDVKGGGHKDGTYLGKTVRWYYSTDERGTINYILTGNNVPETEGATPLMDLPEDIPHDLSYEAYIDKANAILFDIGFYKRPKTAELF